MIEVVAAVIFNAQEQVLCTRRGASRYAYTAFKYEFPGGKIEPGETPQQALKRELMEEMNLSVEVQELIAETTHHYPDFSIRMLSFACLPLNDTFQLKEHTESRWMNIETLPELDWAAADIAIVKALMLKH